MTRIFTAPIVASINHVLDQADWARARLQPFAGKQIRIAMPPFSLLLGIDVSGRFEIGTSERASADLDIELPGDAPLRVLRGSESVMKVVQINGPADLADALGFVMRNLRWDIEEDLSKIVGDIAARRIVAALNAFADWQRQAARNLEENVGEYLVEERQTLVKAFELTGLTVEIEKLRSDLARIERRVEQL